MDDTKNKTSTGMFLGLMLIILGTIWVLNNTGVLDLPIRVWWPFILIGVGLLHFFRHRRLFDIFGWFILGLGILFLLTSNNIINKSEAWKYWPILLVVLGINIVFQKGGKCMIGPPRAFNLHKDAPPHTGTLSSENKINESIIFGSLNKKNNSQKFEGGAISTIFAGAEIDLRAAELPDEGALLEISAIFGGVELRIPDHWIVQTHSTAIFGGVDVKYANREDSEGKRLVINASAIFGGVEIEN